MYSCSEPVLPIYGPPVLTALKQLTQTFCDSSILTASRLHALLGTDVDAVDDLGTRSVKTKQSIELQIDEPYRDGPGIVPDVFEHRLERRALGCRRSRPPGQRLTGCVRHSD